MSLGKYQKIRRESEASHVSTPLATPKKTNPTESYQFDDYNDYEAQLNNKPVSKTKDEENDPFFYAFIVALAICVCVTIYFISPKTSSHPDFINSGNINTSGTGLSGTDLLQYFEDNIYPHNKGVSYYDSFRNYIGNLSSKTGVSKTEILTRDVTPLQYVHSHNDYWRKLPVYDAVLHGVNSIEADIWLLDGEYKDLLAVGHTRAYLKPKEKNLNSLYLNPIKEILDEVNKDGDEKMNGLFYNSHEIPTVLFIDFKNNDTTNLKAYDELIRELKPLKKYLTTQLDFEENHFKPLIIELTGNYPKLSRYENFIFIDSSMIKAFKKEVEFKSPVISESLNNLIRFCKADETMSFEKLGSLDSDDIQVCLKTLINELHNENYRVRVWDVPQFPIYRRNKLWKQQLEDLKVDFLNVDDLDALKEF